MRIHFIFFFTLLAFAFFSNTLAAQPLSINKDLLDQASGMEAAANVRKDSMLLARAFYQYGRAYAFAGNNFLAKRYYLKSIRILEKLPDSYELGHLYVRICEYTVTNASSVEDIKYLNKAIGIFGRIRSSQGLAMAYGMLQGAYGWRWVGDLKKNSPRFQKLIDMADLEIKHARSDGDSSFIVDGYVRKAEAFRIIKEYQMALSLSRKSLAIANATSNDTIKIRSMLTLADIYGDVGASDSTFFYLGVVKQIYLEKNFQQFFILRHLLASFVTYYKSAGNWKMAFTEMQRLNNLLGETEIVNFDKATAVIQQEMEAERTKLILLARDTQIQSDRKLLAGQQKLVVASVCFVLLFAAFCFLFYLLYRKYRHISYKNEQLVIEQNHRVRNNLQLLSSLLSMQARTASDEDARKVISDSRLRVLAMAAIQKQLYESKVVSEIELAEFIPEIIRTTLLACGSDTALRKLSVDQVKLDTDKAVSLGLIAAEVTLNACKYAFTDNPEPELSVTLQSTVKQIRLVIRDNGAVEYEDSYKNSPEKWLHSGSERRQFGKKLIDLLVDQLDGDISYTFEKGTIFALAIPV